MRAAVVYLWQHPVGRLALVAIAFATLGLTTHFWALPMLLLAVPRLRPAQVTA